MAELKANKPKAKKELKKKVRPKKGSWDALVAAAAFAEKSGLAKSYGE